MTLKERIINDFLSNNQRNFSIYRTNFGELSRMYDKLISALKSGTKLERFLNFEGATTSDGKIRFDMEADYIDPEDKQKKIIKTKVVFKYPVYRYFYEQYMESISKIKEKESKIPLPVL